MFYALFVGKHCKGFLLSINEILHRFETIRNHCWLVFTSKLSFYGFSGGAGVRAFTACPKLNRFLKIAGENKSHSFQQMEDEECNPSEGLVKPNLLMYLAYPQGVCSLGPFDSSMEPSMEFQRSPIPLPQFHIEEGGDDNIPCLKRVL